MKPKLKYKYQFGCVDSGGETPSYISNLEVKSTGGEGSARETVCQNSKMHPLIFKKPLSRVAFFLPYAKIIHKILAWHIKLQEFSYFPYLSLP